MAFANVSVLKFELFMENVWIFRECFIPNEVLFFESYRETAKI